MLAPDTGFLAITLGLLLVLYWNVLALSRRVSRLERKMTFTGLVSHELARQRYHSYLSQIQTSKDQAP